METASTTALYTYSCIYILQILMQHASIYIHIYIYMHAYICAYTKVEKTSTTYTHIGVREMEFFFPTQTHFFSPCADKGVARNKRVVHTHLFTYIYKYTNAPTHKHAHMISLVLFILAQLSCKNIFFYCRRRGGGGWDQGVRISAP